MIAVQIYIKKNTLVDSGIITIANFSPYYLIKCGPGTYTTNQFTGHYIRITEGTGKGSISWIASNTATELTLQTPIQVDSSSVYKIYRADYQKLDLFKDEKISITSQIANANDIGKVFTDFTQSFTIPASNKNNKILSHWYESNLDEGFDHRVRYDGYIEIDSQRFKDGNFQLEKASKKNGYIESYSVTFYGNLTQLKDIIQDDKLSSLDFAEYNHTWQANQVINRIESANADIIKYPLIGSKRKFYYQDSAHASEDITTNAGSIKWNELFPAIKISNIFLKIKQRYGIDFTGSFLNEDQYKKLYLYLKPATELVFKGNNYKINLPNVSGSPYIPFPELNTTTSEITLAWNYSPYSYGSAAANSEEIVITIKVVPQFGSTTIPYTIYMYKNGLLNATIDNLVGTYQNVMVRHKRYLEGAVNDVYSFQISATAQFQFDAEVLYDRGYINYYLAVVQYTYPYRSRAFSGSQTISAYIEIAKFMPDMTIYNFLNGIVKAFNLMIIPKENNVYDLNHLEMYYNAGKIMDISEYVYSQEMEIERPKLYKAFNFTYETSANILNTAYKGIYNSNYGDLIYNPISSNESASYDIKLPFENVLFEKQLAKPFQTATIIDKDLKPYIPKPMLIYCNGVESTPLSGSDRIIINTPTGYTPINYWNRFSNEYNSLPTDRTFQGLMSMNFNNEQSSWYNVIVDRGLYYRHYKNYIDNLYNIKTRIVKVKALLPPSLMTSNIINSNNKKIGIALNDRLVIRNKRYIINNMTIDLTSGDTNLELITDYRGVNAASSIGYRYASFFNVETDNQEFTFDTNIYLNDYDYFILKGPADFISYPVTGLPEYSDILLSVFIPQNYTGIDRFDAIGIEYYNDGILQDTNYLTIKQLG
jgi:hypothetical protein